MSSGSNPWSKGSRHASYSTSSSKLTDIMSEQVIAKEFGGFEQTEQALSDYELALKLQEDEDFYSLTEQERQDQLLAQYMQAVEDAERAKPQVTDSLVFEKITTKSSYILPQDEKPSVTIMQPSVTSSAYQEAFRMEQKVDHLQPENKSYLMKVDPMLTALAASQSLSEYEGVGDLTGEGLVVQKNVAAPIKTFIQKQETQAYENKKKK